MDAPITGPTAGRLVLFPGVRALSWMTTLGQRGLRARARAGVPAKSFARAPRCSLAKVGLTAYAGRYPSQLSGGMQRRAELARALINDPDVMLLDEPFRGLDAMSRELMWTYHAALFEESRRTQVFVTSDIDEAVFLADRIWS